MKQIKIEDEMEYPTQPRDANYELVDCFFDYTLIEYCCFREITSTNLKELHLGENVQWLGAVNAPNLTRLEFGPNVTHVGNLNTPQLVELKYPETCVFGMLPKNLTKLELPKYTIEKGQKMPLTEIPPRCFYDMNKLVNLIVPTTITRLCRGAFEGCNYERLRLDVFEEKEYRRMFPNLRKIDPLAFACEDFFREGEEIIIPDDYEFNGNLFTYDVANYTRLPRALYFTGFNAVNAFNNGEFELWIYLLGKDLEVHLTVGWFLTYFEQYKRERYPLNWDEFLQWLEQLNGLPEMEDFMVKFIHDYGTARNGITGVDTKYYKPLTWERLNKFEENPLSMINPEAQRKTVDYVTSGDYRGTGLRNAYNVAVKGFPEERYRSQEHGLGIAGFA